MAFSKSPAVSYFNDPASELQDWPKTPEGYHLFVIGSGGDERIEFTPVSKSTCNLPVVRTAG